MLVIVVLVVDVVIVAIVIAAVVVVVFPVCELQSMLQCMLHVGGNVAKSIGKAAPFP
jgi:hypothetical protein